MPRRDGSFSGAVVVVVSAVESVVVVVSSSAATLADARHLVRLVGMLLPKLDVFPIRHPVQSAKVNDSSSSTNHCRHHVSYFKEEFALL